MESWNQFFFAGGRKQVAKDTIAGDLERFLQSLYKASLKPRNGN